jgi:hypothetical protein
MELFVHATLDRWTSMENRTRGAAVGRGPIRGDDFVVFGTPPYQSIEVFTIVPLRIWQLTHGRMKRSVSGRALDRAGVL